MTVIDDQRKQHKNSQKGYKRPKTWPKDKQNEQNNNNTKLSKGANKGHNETDKNEHNDHLKEPSESLHMTRGKTFPFFPSTLFSYQSFLQPQRIIIVFVAH